MKDIYWLKAQSQSSFWDAGVSFCTKHPLRVNPTSSSSNELACCRFTVTELKPWCVARLADRLRPPRFDPLTGRPWRPESGASGAATSSPSQPLTVMLHWLETGSDPLVCGSSGTAASESCNLSVCSVPEKEGLKAFVFWLTPLEGPWVVSAVLLRFAELASSSGWSGGSDSITLSPDSDGNKDPQTFCSLAELASLFSSNSSVLATLVLTFSRITSTTSGRLGLFLGEGCGDVESDPRGEPV